MAAEAGQARPPAGRRRIAVVGAGWAGLAAAVSAAQQGRAVTLFETAGQPGGRARSLAAMAPGQPAEDRRGDEGNEDAADRAAAPAFTGHSGVSGVSGVSGLSGLRLDNGQHLLIGAYGATLALMREVGVDPEALLLRRPLALLDAQGQGLRLPSGPALIAFTRGVLAMHHWRWRERLALTSQALLWLLRGFRCPAGWTVDQLCARLPDRVRAEFIEPLCVAALNTPARDASAQVLLTVLHDALFGGRGASDLLIPRRPLAELLPEPALAWLTARGAELRLRQRVERLEAGAQGGWRLDGEDFDEVVLACGAAESARLTAAVAPAWSAVAAGFAYEPIITVYVQASGAALVAPMIALAEGPQAPAQFAFDHGALGGQPGLFAFVVSGAAPWVARGLAATRDAVLAQARLALRPAPSGGLSGRGAPPSVLRVVAEKRATFRCVPGLHRPDAAIARGLVAAGDHVAGPYPATLEGAVRSGREAIGRLDTTATPNR